MAKSNRCQKPTCFFHCNFFSIALEQSRNDRQPWTLHEINYRKTIVSSLEFQNAEVFVFPVNINNVHWLLCVLDKNDKKIRIYDSGSSRSYIKKIKSNFQKFLTVRWSFSRLFSHRNLDWSRKFWMDEDFVFNWNHVNQSAAGFFKLRHLLHLKCFKGRGNDFIQSTLRQWIRCRNADNNCRRNSIKTAYSLYIWKIIESHKIWLLILFIMCCRLPTNCVIT